MQTDVYYWFTENLQFIYHKSTTISE